MKISVFSFAVNDKFPIDIMHRQFKKYMKDEFEFILFNDAYDINMEKSINSICAQYNIICVRVPQEIHKIMNPSECYGTTLNWAVQEYAVKNKSEIVILIHTDVFPIQEIDILAILEDKTVVGPVEARDIEGKNTIYFYPALIFIDMTKLKNPKDLNFGLKPGLDTGGRSHTFIEKYPNEVKFIFNHQIPNLLKDMRDRQLEYFTTDLAICRSHGLSAGWIADGFYHHLAGSQWNSDNPVFAEGHRKRMELFLGYFY